MRVIWNRSQKDQGHLVRTERWERMKEGIGVLKIV